jgi:hypothetical protein
MDRLTRPAWLLVLLCACGGESPPAAPPTSAAPAPAVPSPSAPAEASPCAIPGPLTIELEAGVLQKTPWGLEITYAIEEDEKARQTRYVFLMRSGTRRWEVRRDDSNWTEKMTWRGFCWRGGARPELRASKLQLQMAPVCKDGKLVELGGCGNALGD